MVEGGHAKSPPRADFGFIARARVGQHVREIRREYEIAGRVLRIIIRKRWAERTRISGGVTRRFRPAYRLSDDANDTFGITDKNRTVITIPRLTARRR